MESEHLRILRQDFKQAYGLAGRLATEAKLLYYGVQRIAADVFLKNYFKKILGDDQSYRQVDRRLLNDGGMFKRYAYGLCNRFAALKGACVCVPGIGYGRNLFQLAAFRPKTIIALDMYGYTPEWQFLRETIGEKFKVEVSFLQEDLHTFVQHSDRTFDYVVTDAVLEHCADMPAFAKQVKAILKKNGIFYASFGPLWYGPGGDHIGWGNEGIFNHLILPEGEYRRRFQARFPDVTPDSTEGAFIVKNRLLSYLPAQDYLDILYRQGFVKLECFAKISTAAMQLLAARPDIGALLDERQVPLFDRYCSGLYLWMRV